MFNEVYDPELAAPDKNDALEALAKEQARFNRGVFTVHGSADYDDDETRPKKKKGKRRKKGKNQRGKKKDLTNRAPDSTQLDLLRAGIYVGKLEARNETLEAMMRLALAASKGTLRQDVLEVGFEVLDGK